jgi:uncharacterized protein YdaU (DUF1376 family)
MHYYQHHIGDFIKDTSRLTDSQSMAYLRLIWLYYEQEKPLVNDPKVLAFKIGTDEQTIDLILKGYFKLENNEWHQTRCDDVIGSYQKQSTGGKLGAQIRWGKGKPKGAYSPPIATPIATNNHKPLTINHKPNINTPDGVSESLFKDYLEVRKGKKAKWTETALKGLQREADKAKMSLSEVMQLCCERGWAGFKAEWAKEEVIKQKMNPLITNDQIEEAYRTECGKDPKLARFGSYYEMKDYVIKQRELRARTQA